MEINQIPLTDRYGRRLNYLRISVTDRCNLRCLYCMPREGIKKLRHGAILTYEEILRLARIAVGLGIEKVRLTGGEPLVRQGIFEFIPKLTALPGLKDVTITTNGVYLKDNLGRLRSAGIQRINVSLDTLRPRRYEKITGYDGFEKVMQGIELARKLKFHPIKINVVVIKGLNEDEILDFAKLSIKAPYHIRFIEYMPIGVKTGVLNFRYVPNDWIKGQLSRIAELVQVSKGAFDGPAEYFRFPGAAGQIGFISAVSQHFCHACNRLRLTATGNLRPCLLSDWEIDLKSPMRTGVSDSELAQIFLKAALNKPRSHFLACENSTPLFGQMSEIGG
jgi:cyclic pyranopterin phosphate synthase